MCKHIPNAQVSVRTQCCRKWYDCPTCHDELEDHSIKKTVEITFICKKCKKAFRKDLTEFDEADSFCPHCDNQFVLPGTASESVETEEPALLSKLGGLDARMIRNSDVRDEDFGIIDYTKRLG